MLKNLVIKATKSKQSGLTVGGPVKKEAKPKETNAVPPNQSPPNEETKEQSPPPIRQRRKLNKHSV